MANVNKNKETAAEKIARLQAEIAAAQNEVAAEETARLEKLASLIREFPKSLGVATFGDVINLIKQVEKGTLGKVDASAGRTYVRLTDEQKNEIKATLKAGGPAAQPSALVAKYGVSAGTIHGLKQEAGLVKSRTEAAPAVAAVATA